MKRQDVECGMAVFHEMQAEGFGCTGAMCSMLMHLLTLSPQPMLRESLQAH